MRQTFKYVYLLSPNGFRDEHDDLEVNRNVYIIYGSDRPIDVKAIHETTKELRGKQTADLRAMLAIAPIPKLFEPLRHAFTEWCETPWCEVLPDSDAETLLKNHREPLGRGGPLILTDQRCPVDNLMSEVFRDRERRDKK
jgi:hypothetical protein